MDYIDRRDTSLVFRTCCWDKEKLVNADQDIRQSDTNTAAVGRHVITFDYPLNIVKYNTQQLLGSLLNSELGTNFLNTVIMEDICNVFSQVDRYWAKVEEWSQHRDTTNKMNTTVKEEARNWNRWRSERCSVR